MTDIISPLPYVFSNGSLADATQVDANFSQVVTSVNSNAVNNSAISTDGTMSANSDSLIPSQKAVKTYVDTRAGALQISAIGLTSDTTISFPAKSVPLSVTLRETSGGTFAGAGMQLQFGSGAPVGFNKPLPNDVYFNLIGSSFDNHEGYGAPGGFYSTSPVPLSITAPGGGWGSAVVDVTITYITLP